MMTVRSRARLKCSASSAVMGEVAMNSGLRQGAIDAASPRRSSILDRKQDAWSRCRPLGLGRIEHRQMKQGDE
ncbi:hypothetical protein ABZT23_21225 [Streptomyces sp. NPDC005386]|uniref:hypothetical protein n=1 Tax=unclassified Streptomyces TaxID=2593676 RepID=UPI0033A0117D